MHFVCQKETTTESKHHQTEDFRLNGMDNSCLFRKNFSFYFAILLIYSYLSFIPAITYADSPLSNDSEQGKMLALINNIYSQFNELPVKNEDLTKVSMLFSGICDSISPKSYRKLALLADAKDYDNDWGFGIRGRFSHRIDGTRNNLDDNGVNSPPGYLELSWDILSEGYFENKGRAHSLRNEAQLAELDGQLTDMTNGYRCTRYQLAQNFSGFSSHILTLRLALMESISSVERRAYFKGWSQFNELLVSEEELVHVRHELSFMHDDPQLDIQITDIFNPPLIDIDMKAVATAVRDDFIQPQIHALKKEVLESREDARFNNRFRFFVREGVIRNNQFGQNGTNIGVAFTIPLTLKRKDSLKYRLLEIESEEELKSWERLTKVRYAYSLVRNQQKQVIRQHYRYQRALDKLRNSLVSLRINYEDEDDLIIAVTRLRTLLDVAFELNEVKKELYWRINEVFLLAGVEFQSDFIRLYDLPTENEQRRSWDRSVYVWSKSFNTISNPDILDFLHVKGINKVSLSAGKKVNTEKMSLFLQQAHRNDLEVELMVGSNQWIFPENHGRAAMTVLMAAEQQDAIHLDIEPQIFSDFKQRTRYYLENYIAMLSEIRQKIPSSQLTVAVPLHWPMEFYEQTTQLVDGVYIMAYGSNSNTLIRRLQPIIQTLGKNKITVVLRVKDFNDEWELEKLMEEISHSLGISRFGFENLASFYKLAGQQQ